MCERAKPHVLMCALSHPSSGPHQGAAELTGTTLRMQQEVQSWAQTEMEKRLDSTGRKWVEKYMFLHSFQPYLSFSV